MLRIWKFNHTIPRLNGGKDGSCSDDEASMGGEGSQTDDDKQLVNEAGEKANSALHCSGSSVNQYRLAYEIVFIYQMVQLIRIIGVNMIIN